MEGLTRASTVLELKERLSAFMEGVAANCVAVKYGFPPQRLEAAFSDALGDVGLRPGDVLVAEETAPQEIPLSDTEMHSLRDDAVALPPMTAGRPPRVTREQGQLVRRPVAADNSCLFSSLGHALFQEQSLAPSLRRICAAGVVADEELTEAMLEKPREAYCAWIMLPSAWGGSIELVLLSKHFGISIAVCDIKSQRIFHYGPETSEQRVYLLYDGIHYDPLAWGLPDNSDIDVTLFDPRDSIVEEQALALATSLHKDHSFTDVGSFTLRCLECGVGVVGNEGAVAHSTATGHASYSEFK